MLFKSISRAAYPPDDGGNGKGAEGGRPQTIAQKYRGTDKTKQIIDAHLFIFNETKDFI
jgi:hypothetical protein